MPEFLGSEFKRRVPGFNEKYATFSGPFPEGPDVKDIILPPQHCSIGY